MKKRIHLKISWQLLNSFQLISKKIKLFTKKNSFHLTSLEKSIIFLFWGYLSITKGSSNNELYNLY